ncbi:MAG: acylase [Gemmatimonadetes bacterium 13_2_20CM_2_65_7]|nr:MAG: acylase [Gemmatimonadetes bacterium 13_2_20CM_2_65_7]OLD00623.1 MAG: acylase [Gemmatimonadetes bacterium 13_1_40CM_3_65_8]
MRRLSILFLFVVTTGAQRGPAEFARWQREARAVTIIRDDWGIAHIYGKTDADAVFGMIYAQAEDDFNRVETNYINAMGRLAEADGEAAIYQDLRMKLFINPDSLRAQYARSPAWLKSLMNAWADGLNFFLYEHPDVKPRVITRFEPWMALSFTEGSIGGDIERIDLRQLQAFYDSTTGPTTSSDDDDPGGSNGFAIAPSNTLNHHALLLINPHTSFFFRAELQVVSEQGLDAYGAVTWGQIFVYQGFNDRVGWMHTSSGVDAIDEYLETVVKKGNRYFYRHGSAERPMTVATITVPYKTAGGAGGAGGMARKTFTVYSTHHGPIVRRVGDRWVSIRLMQDPIHALTQSYSRTKAKSYQAFRRTMELHTNSSNNTVYADAAGNIAYFHGNFIPRRDTSFDWTRPVDGSNPATEWQGLLSVDETPHLLNPASGWLYNSNDAPWWAAGGGASSPRKEDYPAYVQTGGGTARGRHAVRVLQNTKDFTLESLRAGAYDSYLTWFAEQLPALIQAWDSLPAGDSLKTKVAEPIEQLRNWDLRWSAASIPTAVAVFWGERLGDRSGRGAVQALAEAVDRLTADFVAWKTPWGEINRFQRLTDDIVHPFTDSGPSIPVPFTSARWGSLAAFGARPYPGTKQWYGTYGNSFVAVVEFGDSVRAKAVTAGGESGHPGTLHFNDEAVRYAAGDLRDVYFYRSQLKGHTEREYHPGN